MTKRLWACPVGDPSPLHSAPPDTRQARAHPAAEAPQRRSASAQREAKKAPTSPETGEAGLKSMPTGRKSDRFPASHQGLTDVSTRRKSSSRYPAISNR